MQTRKNLVHKTIKKKKIKKRFNQLEGTNALTKHPKGIFNSQSAIPKIGFIKSLFTSTPTYTKNKIINHYHKTLAGIHSSKSRNKQTAYEQIKTTFFNPATKEFNFKKYYNLRIRKGILNLDKKSTKNAYYPISKNNISKPLHLMPIENVAKEGNRVRLPNGRIETVKNIIQGTKSKVVMVGDGNYSKSLLPQNNAQLYQVKTNTGFVAVQPRPRKIQELSEKLSEETNTNTNTNTLSTQKKHQK